MLRINPDVCKRQRFRRFSPFSVVVVAIGGGYDRRYALIVGRNQLGIFDIIDAKSKHV